MTNADIDLYELSQSRCPYMVSTPAPREEKAGQKFDDGKLHLDLLPMRALQEVAKVLKFGVAKYGEREGWRRVRPRRLYFAAAMRHLFDRALGERTDPESGLPHLAHAACDVLFLLAFDVGLDPTDAFETSQSDSSSEG